MAGFFHQLAERALQPAATLHSNASLPHAPVPEPVEEPWLPASGTPPGIFVAEERRRTPPPRAVVPSATAAALPATTIEVRTAPYPGEASRKRRRPPAVAPKRPPRATKPQRKPATTPQPPLPAVPARADPATTRASSNAETDRVAIKGTPVRPQPSPGRRNFGVATHAARAAVRRKPAPFPRRAVEPPTEVHIHIGRIELTASSPPPPKPAAATVKRPMSLDEYLQQRRGRNGAGAP